MGLFRRNSNQPVTDGARRFFSPSNAQMYLSLHLPAIALGFGMGVTTPALPIFAKSFDVSAGVASLVFFANMLGGLIASLPVGYLLDRFGRRKSCWQDRLSQVYRH